MSVHTSAMRSLLDRAAILPGKSLTRSKKVFGRFGEVAQGAYIWDTDGRRYIDMLCGLGAISLGYRPRSLEQAQASGVMSLPHYLEVEAAEAVLTYVAPWASWVRFTKTGSESTTAALLMAKAVTGRTRVLRLDGSYHGWHGWPETCDIFAAGDLPDTSDAAAVFIEPHRFQPVNLLWLGALRELCDYTGTMLVFDSMIYGGRWSIGGLSAWSGVQPDLECFGKAYGNGQAVAFVVGTQNTYAHGEIASGTYSGELSGLAAVIETLGTYTSEPVIDTMAARGRQLRKGMDAIVPTALGEIQGHYPACQHLQFHNPEHGQQFSQAMLERGVIWHPLPVLTMYAHTEAHIEQVLEAAKESLEALQ